MPPKRRASTKATQQAPPEPKKPKVVPEDVVEPMETDGTPGPSISKEFSNTCQKLEAVLDQVNEIKKKDSPSVGKARKSNKRINNYGKFRNRI